MRYGVVGLVVGLGLGLACGQFFSGNDTVARSTPQAPQPQPVAASTPTATPAAPPAEAPPQPTAPLAAASRPNPMESLRAALAANNVEAVEASLQRVEHPTKEDLVALEEVVRLLLDRRQSPDDALRLLKAVGAPAHRVLVDLYELCLDGDQAQIFGEVLRGVSDPRLGELVVKHHETYVANSETSWVAMTPSMALLVEHSGERGVAVVAEALNNAQGQRSQAALMALGGSSDPRLLEAGLRHLRGPQGAFGAERGALGLARAYGADGRARLLEVGADSTLARDVRMAATEAVGRTCRPDEVSTLLSQHSNPDQAVAFLGLATGLATRSQSGDGVDLALPDLTLVRQRVLALLTEPDAEAWLSAVYAVEYNALFHTVAIRDTLRRLAETTPAGKAKAARDALRSVERTLGR
jgi:hypothetical protein